jgi:hypothetical protein
VHIVVCAKTDSFSKEQFEVAYEYLFKKINVPQSDIDLNKLIVSLEQLFKITSGSEKTKIQIGAFGELLFLLYVYNNGYTKILEKYHSSFYSKHDIEINEKVRIEIKTSATSTRIHRFKHDQIFRDDVKVFVGSLLLEQSKEGMSLYTLFEKIMSLINNSEQLLEIGAIRGMCGVSEDKPGPSFSYDRAISQIKIFRAEDLPHINIGFINGITNIAYDVDCELADTIKIEDFVNYLNSLD